VLSGGVPSAPPLALDAGEWTSAVRPGDIVVFDDYSLGRDEVTAVSARGGTVALVDDRDSIDLPADVVVVPSWPTVVALHASTVLSGPRFAPITGSIRARRRPHRARTDRLLVTMGGGDHGGNSVPIARAIAGLVPFSVVNVLAGALAAQREVGALAGLPGVEVSHHVRDPASLFSVCDAAISAAGVTTWELLCIGVPTAVLVVAENQAGVAALAADHGAAIGLSVGDVEGGAVVEVVEHLADPATQRRLHDAGQDLVDGRGAERVCSSLTGNRP